nr:dna repair protein rhp7 [Quercus suber]
MSGRRNGNRIRGPQSALTDFLASQNISAAQIRDDYERRQREAAQQTNAGEGPSNAAGEQEEEDEALAATEQAEEEEKSRKRKRSQKETIAKIKISKKKNIKKGGKKGKKGEDDDDDDTDDYDGDFANDMYKKSRPAPGQFEHCEICSKRFTVTPYSKEGPDGGLLCTPCGKAQTKDLKSEKKAVNKPAGRKRRKLESDRLDGIAVGGAKPLVQLCIQKVAKHHEEIEELGDLPAPLVEKLSEIFSKQRVMKSKALPLFLRPDLDSVVIPDAAYLEEEDYQQIFAIVPNMQKLALSNCCQLKDASIQYMLERCHKLRHVQLYAANLVSTEMWHRLFEQMGDRLEVLKLNWLDAAFEDQSVEEMVKHCKNIERLKLKLCRRIGRDAVNALCDLPRLKHLSLHVGQEVSDAPLMTLIHSHGANLITLSLEKFFDVSDVVLEYIHHECRQLSKLRFSENETATDAGFAALFTDWANPPLAFIDLNSTRDVDNSNPDGPEEATGLGSSGFRALMAHSGSNLRHLDVSSCRHIELGAFLDVFQGAATYPALEYINLSFCNRVDTSVVAGIFKSCPALKQLVAFGCFDVQDVVVPRNIALIGVPRAQDAIEQHGVGIGVDEAIGMMVEPTDRTRIVSRRYDRLHGPGLYIRHGVAGSRVPEASCRPPHLCAPWRSLVAHSDDACSDRRRMPDIIPDIHDISASPRPERAPTHPSVVEFCPASTSLGPPFSPSVPRQYAQCAATAPRGMSLVASTSRRPEVSRAARSSERAEDVRTRWANRHPVPHQVLSLAFLHHSFDSSIRAAIGAPVQYIYLISLPTGS